jgi:hypothetical protein
MIDGLFPVQNCTPEWRRMQAFAALELLPDAEDERVKIEFRI